MLHQQAQQPLLRLGQLHLRPVPHKAQALKVEGKGPQLQRGRRGAPPPQQAVHPGPQHRQGEGLGHVVVRPQLQTRHLVALQVVGGENQHRHPAGSPQRGEKIQSVSVGQVEIQQHQRVFLFAQGRPALGQGGRHPDFPALSGQRQGDPPPQRLIIFYQQNPLHAPPSPVSRLLS